MIRCRLSERSVGSGNTSYSSYLSRARYSQMHWHDDNKMDCCLFAKIMSYEKDNRDWVIVHLHTRDTTRISTCYPIRGIQYIKNRHTEKNSTIIQCHDQNGYDEVQKLLLNRKLTLDCVTSFPTDRVLDNVMVSSWWTMRRVSWNEWSDPGSLEYETWQITHSQ